jgi:hypothetical protein
MVLEASHDGYHRRLLAPVHVLAAVSPRHRFASVRKLEIAELADEALLLLSRDYASRGLFDAACNVAHIKPRVILESAAPHTLLALARTGTMLPSCRRMSGFRLPVSAPFRWYTGALRSGDGLPWLGIRSVFWPRMPNPLSMNSSPIAADIIPGASLQGGRHPLRSRPRRTVSGGGVRTRACTHKMRNARYRG